jgi:hypothetical protein
LRKQPAIELTADFRAVGMQPSSATDDRNRREKIARYYSSSRTLLSSGRRFGFTGGGSISASASAERPIMAAAIACPKSFTVPKPTAASG